MFFALFVYLMKRKKYSVEEEGRNFRCSLSAEFPVLCGGLGL